jgi:hypothetical protein
MTDMQRANLGSSELSSLTVQLVSHLHHQIRQLLFCLPLQVRGVSMHGFEEKQTSMIPSFSVQLIGGASAFAT